MLDGNIPETVPEFWRLFRLWADNFEENRTREMALMHEVNERFIESLKSIDGRVDSLESDRDRIISRVPNLVDEHEKELGAIKQWIAKVDMDPGIAKRLNTMERRWVWQQATATAIGTIAGIGAWIIAQTSKFIGTPPGHP